MTGNFLCEYKKNSTVISEEKHQDKVKLIQLFVENGLMKIGETSYPIVYGDLYFLDAKQSYCVEELDEEMIHSTIMVSAEQLMALSNILDFELEYHKIFGKNGHFHVASPHYKAIDKRFKEAFSVSETGKPFSKALFFSRVIELLNYAVVTVEKRK